MVRSVLYIPRHKWSKKCSMAQSFFPVFVCLWKLDRKSLRLVIYISLAQGSLWSPFLSFDTSAEGFDIYWEKSLLNWCYFMQWPDRPAGSKFISGLALFKVKKASPRIVTSDLGSRGAMYMLEDRVSCCCCKVFKNCY